jgi:hypothetical protein
MSKRTANPAPPRTLTAADVGDLILDGHRIAHVRELLCESGISGAKAENLIEAAIDDLIDDSSRLDENQRRGWLLSAAKSIYRRQVELGDLNGAASTIRMMGGLKRPLSRDEIAEQAQALELYEETTRELEP